LYPKPSQYDPLISWTDHKDFNMPGQSKNTGYYEIKSRKQLISRLKGTNFNVLNVGVNYSEYIKASFECKIIINPPGIGEYTSRMFDQTYLGNCIVLRKNSYDNGLSWKPYIPEIDFYKTDWAENLGEIIKNYKTYQHLSREYFDNNWTPKAIVDYFVEKINEKRI